MAVSTTIDDFTAAIFCDSPMTEVDHASRHRRKPKRLAEGSSEWPGKSAADAIRSAGLGLQRMKKTKLTCQVVLQS